MTRYKNNADDRKQNTYYPYKPVWSVADIFQCHAFIPTNRRSKGVPAGNLNDLPRKHS